ncbi:FAD-dependent oxidoreductase [Halorubrum persicum]|uniref:FAD-dependent oxidoreductase n=1 Tax=Halorubrum persicum TaxID=1383844 RepID=A0A2G1WER9_9EURY|nr:FAD-binding oxidoreductase [Halorubrum persicum]PHQ37481.1 FAD-dependent oxidoreductase [Halorubrum persicum]
MTVVIIGGGIVGCASAYYLAERGADVILFERASLGAGATDRAAGGIREQFSTEVNIRLSQAAISVWETFEANFGTDIKYRRPGYLYLARDDSTAALFEETVTFQNDHGVDSRILDPEEATEYVPGLRTGQYVAAAYCPTGGFADPHLGLQGFSMAATEAGAAIETGVAVTDLRVRDGRVVGVDTTEGRYDADVVVNAAGSWSPQIASMVGIDLPVTPKRRQALIVDPESPVPDSNPLVTDLDDGCYFRPERNGQALVGGHFGSDQPYDPDKYEKSHDLDWAADVVEHVATVADHFGPDSRVIRGWAGLYAMTPDHHPIIEESMPGLLTATGFSGHGFMQSPATGQLVAELVLDGEATTVDISPLARDRFERGEALHETYFSA